MKQQAFVFTYDGLVRVLHTKVAVFPPLTFDEMKNKKINLNYLAIWDTGATNSAITKKVVDELGLKATGVREVRHADGKSVSNTYLVNILLPGGLMVGNVRVTEVKLIPDDNTKDEWQPQVLIGMDIIGIGDFAVTNSDGKTTMSFRTPSITKINFVPEAKENNILEGGNRDQRRKFEAMKRSGKI